LLTKITANVARITNLGKKKKGKVKEAKRALDKLSLFAH